MSKESKSETSILSSECTFLFPAVYNCWESHLWSSSASYQVAKFKEHASHYITNKISREQDRETRCLNQNNYGMSGKYMPTSLTSLKKACLNRCVVLALVFN